MEPKEWQMIERREVFDHPRMKLVEDEVKLPNGQHTDYLRMAPVEAHSVAIIAMNGDKEILLQREYSYPPNQIMWQLPGGSVGIGEDILDAAKRELSEESGFTAKSCEIAGFYYTNNRRSDERQYVVVCTELAPQNAEGDPEEFISNHWMPVDELDKLITNGEIENAFLLAALNLWRHVSDAGRQ